MMHVLAVDAGESMKSLTHVLEFVGTWQLGVAISFKALHVVMHADFRINASSFS